VRLVVAHFVPVKRLSIYVSPEGETDAVAVTGGLFATLRNKRPYYQRAA